MKSTPLRHGFRAWLVIAGFMSATVAADVIAVGPGLDYETLIIAVAEAKPGDTIAVHPRPNNAPYQQTALNIDRKLTIYAVRDADDPPIPLTGDGFDYSGQGNTPRAIVQFSPGSDGSLLKGFELTGARNRSTNAAGVRILGANQITIAQCVIHRNDMGIMSSAISPDATALGQRIEDCHIHHNGPPQIRPPIATPQTPAINPEDLRHERDGYAHNLYLDGESVTILGCNIHHATGGHNIKSRARFNLIEASYIHSATNREIDLVDSAMTRIGGERRGLPSGAVLVGNIIVKDPKTRGNRAVIQFGQDGDQVRVGTLVLLHNTIVSPFISPIVDLSSRGVGVVMINNIIDDGTARSKDQILITAERNGASLDNVEGNHNWFSPGFVALVRSLPLRDSGTGQIDLPFRDPADGDYRLTVETRGITDAGQRVFGLPHIPGKTTPTGELELYEFTPPLGHELRRFRARPDLGAHEQSR